MQYPVRSGPIQNDAATFSPEMFHGSIPRREPRLPFKTQHPQPLAQTTHVNAPDVPSMWTGSKPDQPRILVASRIPLPTLSPDVVSFLLEFGGYHPDSPRILLGPKIGQPIAQTAHVSAAFSQDMVAGWKPDRAPRLPLGVRIPLPSVENIVTPFAFEPLIGWHPDRPSLGPFKTQHVPAISQTTHVQSAFSIDMVERVYPDAPIRLKPQQPDQVPLIFIQPFSFESVYGYHPDSPRLFYAPKIPLPLITFIDTFSFETFRGYQPDKARIFLGPRIALPISQTSPIAAPFSQDMVQGSAVIPAKYRPLWFPRTQTFILPVIIGQTVTGRLVRCIIGPENRTITIGSENRTIVIGAEPE